MTVAAAAATAAAAAAATTTCRFCQHSGATARCYYPFCFSLLLLDDVEDHLCFGAYAVDVDESDA